MDKIPLYSVDLIKELDKSYPNKHPSLNTSEREIWYNAGARSVVDALLVSLKEQEEEGLASELNVEGGFLE